MEMLQAACQQFLGKSEADIHKIALETLEGHQRAIMGNMTVEVKNVLYYCLLPLYTVRKSKTTVCVVVYLHVWFLLILLHREIVSPLACVIDKAYTLLLMGLYVSSNKQPELAGTRMSSFWILLELRVTCKAPVKSSHQQTNTQLFAGPSCCRTSSVRALKGKYYISWTC